MIHRLTLWTTAVWLVLATAAQAFPAVDIALREEVTTDRREFTLGDVATVRCEDARLAARLRALPVGRAPRVGYAIGVGRPALEAQLERTFRGLYRRTQWSGAPATRVRAVGRSVDLATYGDVARDHLSAWLASRASDFEVTLETPRHPMTLPTGRIDVTPRIAVGQPQRRTPVWLDVSIDGEPYTSERLWFTVSAFRDVLVARRDLEPGTQLLPEHVVRRRVDLAETSALPLPGLDVPSDQRVERFVPAGAVLSRDALGPIPAVTAGGHLVVVAEAGAVRIEAAAIALEDGARGETIRVRPAHGDGGYRVLVTGPNRAQVGADE